MSNEQFGEPYERITYEYLGIDPHTFYDGKFCGGETSQNYLNDPRNRFDIEFSRLRFLASNIKEGRVLDLGCGSGPYAKTLKEYCNVSEIVGVDMDPKCVEIAKSSYDKAEVFELAKKLPFDDNYFDVVFSVDFFGHIEFRYKNLLIEEIHRVTRPSGLSVHIIESGELDYLKIDLRNPQDKLLQYITMEGHIGIESAYRIKKRWERYFNVISIENAFIYPIYPLTTYLAGQSFGPEFSIIISDFSEKEKKAAQICLGFVCDYLKQIARNISPDMLMPRDSDEILSIYSPYQKLISEIFQKSCGLIFLVCKKRS